MRHSLGLSLALGAAVALSVHPARAGSGPREPDLAAAEEVFTQALAAQRAGDSRGYRHGIEKAAALLPDPTRLLYRLAGARLGAGDRNGALAALRRQIDASFGRDPRPDPQFAALLSDREFQAEMQRLDALAEPIVASSELFRLPERDALFEGIARDPASGAWFFSSVHRRKVVRRAADGTITDFVPSGAHGLACALGIAIDADRNLLWIVSAGLPQAAGITAEERDRSALLAVALDSGELRYRIPSPAGKHWWNDLVVARDGTVFVSDAGTAGVMRVAPDGVASTIVDGHGLRSPGGVALSADERLLYLADWTNGLAVIDLSSGSFHWMRPPAGSTVLGIDGLRRVGGSLIAIQNGVAPQRIARLVLSDDGREIASGTLLERGVPDWDEPTLGIEVGGDFVYVGSSHWPRFGEDGSSPDPATLSEPQIRRLRLP